MNAVTRKCISLLEPSVGRPLTYDFDIPMTLPSAFPRLAMTGSRDACDFTKQFITDI